MSAHVTTPDFLSPQSHASPLAAATLVGLGDGLRVQSRS